MIARAGIRLAHGGGCGRLGNHVKATHVSQANNRGVRMADDEKDYAKLR